MWFVQVAESSLDAGLPYNVTEEQIREFFSGFEISSIKFVHEPDGRPSGLVRLRTCSSDPFMTVGDCRTDLPCPFRRHLLCSNRRI